MTIRIAMLAAAAVLAATAAHPAERPLHLYLEFALSPDGARLASIEADATLSGPVGPQRQLLIRPLDGSPPTPLVLPCAGQPVCAPTGLAWSADGARLAFTLHDPVGHGQSVYEADADGRTLIRLLQFEGTLEHLRYLQDGRLVMLAVEDAIKEVGATQAGAAITGDLGGPPPEQRIAVLGSGRLTFVSPPDLFVYEYDVAADGSLVGVAAPGDGDANWWIAKLHRFGPFGDREIFSPPNAQTQVAHPRISPDGKSVAFIAGIMSDFGSTGGDVWLAPLDGGPARDLTPNSTVSATSLAWDCQGRLLAMLLAGAETRIVRLPTDGGEPQVLWSGQESLSGPDAGVDLACPGGASATERQSFTHAPELWAGPIGAWKPLTNVNAGLDLPFVARRLVWRSGGHDVQGWLVLPNHAGGGKMPMVTVVHGGPAAAATSHYLGPGSERGLLQRGYALLLPNPRGSFGGGEAFTLANVRDFGHGDLQDILAGVDAAIAAAPIDPDRLGLMGGSYGGYLTMWAVTQTHRFKAAVAEAGISDWLSYYGENGIDEWMIPYFGRSVYEDPAAYARSSPINFIRNVTTPTFVYVGARDIECPYPQTQEFWHALRDLGVATSMAIYPGEGHGLRDPTHAADAERRTLDWFDRYLK